MKKSRQQRWRELWRRRNEEPHAMLAIVMAGIAALFIFSIAMAYHYASTTVTARSPERATTSVPETADSAPRAAEPSTTGSGGSSRW
jgi:hypothetical protein